MENIGLNLEPSLPGYTRHTMWLGFVTSANSGGGSTTGNPHAISHCIYIERERYLKKRPIINVMRVNISGDLHIPCIWHWWHFSTEGQWTAPHWCVIKPLSWGSTRQKVSREGAHICPYTRIDMLLIKLSLRRYHRDHGNKGNNLSRPFSLQTNWAWASALSTAGRTIHSFTLHQKREQQ